MRWQIHWHTTCGLAQWRRYPADNFVRTSPLLPRSKFSGSRHFAKPLERCAQRYAAIRRENFETSKLTVTWKRAVTWTLTLTWKSTVKRKPTKPDNLTRTEKLIKITKYEKFFIILWQIWQCSSLWDWLWRSHEKAVVSACFKSLLKLESRNASHNLRFGAMAAEARRKCSENLKFCLPRQV